MMFMKTLQGCSDALLHLLYPRYCAGCGRPLLKAEQVICLTCIRRLPQTHFHLLKINPVEKIFRGRFDFVKSVACFYFSKSSLLQQIIHQMKYRGRKDIGLYMGAWMGRILKEDPDLAAIDTLIPVPLYPAREKKRGYNQAALLAEGMASELSVSISKDAIRRIRPSSTQTRKSRIARWENVAGIFRPGVQQPLHDQHVLLVDDVVTTGATIEACAAALQSVPGIKISVATLAFAGN
jgi:ComF family protein